MPTNSCHFTESATQTCLSCTGQPYVPSVPGYVATNAVTGWDTGANSVTVLANDLEWSHSIPEDVTGGITGLRQYDDRESRSPANITHGWWFARVGGALLAQPIESGRRIGVEPIGVSGGAQLKVRRVRGVITYLIGSEPYGPDSPIPSAGPVVAGAVLFSSGDRIY